MTKRQTTRSHVIRRVGVALAASIAVSTVASTGTSAAVKPSVTAPNLDATAKVAIFDTFPGWCFGNNPANSSLMAARTIYESLFEKTVNNEVVGLLAESATPSADLKTWTVVLRKGITFHDGTDFNAAAVIKNFLYSTSDAHFNAILTESARIAGGGATTQKQKLAYAAAIKKGSSTAVAGLSMAGKAKSVLDLAYTLSTATAFSANLLPYASGGYSATGTHTVVFKLDRPQNDFPGTLYASGRSFMRAPAQFEDGAGDCASTPIGTGPFQVENVKDWSTNKLKVVRNDNYWRKDAAGGKLPYLKQITFENVKETSLRQGAVLRGTYDAAMFASGGDGNQIKSLRKAKSKVSEIKSPLEYYPSLWLNQGRPGSPFNPAVSTPAGATAARKAVIACLDRKNYAKVRTLGEAAPAKSIVGPNNVMYSTTGFGSYSLAKAKALVKAYKTASGKKKLTFTTPADVSSASQANTKFLKDMWKKCGIDLVIKTSESADIIAKAFNASPDATRGEYYNAYDSIVILLMEGTDVTFNAPFVLTNSYTTGSPAAAYGDKPRPYGLAAGGVVTTSGTPANLAYTKSLVYGASLGTVLSLNHHTDTKVDDIFNAAQALPNGTDAEKAAVKAKFAEGTALLQTEGVMSSIVHIYYTMFVNKKSTLQNVGETLLPSGDKQRKMTNWGIDWSGVYKTK